MLIATAIASLLAAAACLAYAFLALLREKDTEKQVKDGLEHATALVAAARATATGGEQGLAGDTKPELAFSGAAELVKGLGAFAEALSKLRQGLAALVLAFAFVIFAGVAAGIEEKVKDKTPTTSTTTEATPKPAP